ncbi:Hypothetical protein (Fragment), partial [Durusdinium trenchii]
MRWTESFAVFCAATCSFAIIREHGVQGEELPVLWRQEPLANVQDLAVDVKGVREDERRLLSRAVRSDQAGDLSWGGCGWTCHKALRTATEEKYFGGTCDSDGRRRRRLKKDKDKKDDGKENNKQSNPETCYLDAHFTDAFGGSALVLGEPEFGRYISFLSPNELRNIQVSFSGGGKDGTLPTFCASGCNGGQAASIANKLLATTAALTLNVQFDLCGQPGNACSGDPFGPSPRTYPLSQYYLVSNDNQCCGKTVREVIEEANCVLSGRCSDLNNIFGEGLSLNQLVTCTEKINQNYDSDGNWGANRNTDPEPDAFPNKVSFEQANRDPHGSANADSDRVPDKSTIGSSDQNADRISNRHSDRDANGEITMMCRPPIDGEYFGSQFNAGDYIFRLREENNIPSTDYCVRKGGNACINTGTLSAREVTYFALQSPIAGLKVHTNPRGNEYGVSDTEPDVKSIDEPDVKSIDEPNGKSDTVTDKEPHGKPEHKPDSVPDQVPNQESIDESVNEPDNESIDKSVNEPNDKSIDEPHGKSDRHEPDRVADQVPDTEPNVKSIDKPHDESVDEPNERSDRVADQEPEHKPEHEPNGVADKVPDQESIDEPIDEPDDESIFEPNG